MTDEPSRDFLVTGDGVVRNFDRNPPMSLVVRHVPAPDVPSELKTENGQAHIALTKSPRSPMWHGVLRGGAVAHPRDAPHPRGECFEPSAHCEFVKDPPDTFNANG